MKPTRKQHYIWRKYLRAWSNESDQIYCSFNNKKPILAGLMKVANKKDFYKLKELSRFEINFLKSSINKNLPFEIIDILSNWVDLYNFPFKLEKYSEQSLSPESHLKFKKIIENYKIQQEEDNQNDIENDGIMYIDNLLNKNLDLCLTDKNIMSFYIFVCEQYFRTKRIYDDLINAQVEYKNLVNFENVINPLRHIMSYDLAYRMCAKKYKSILLINNTSQEFITGDQPVVNMFADYTKLNKHTNSLMFYYPISPRIAVLISTELSYKNGETLSISIKDVDKYNKKIIEASQQQIYCSNQSALDTYFNFNPPCTNVDFGVRIG